MAEAVRVALDAEERAAGTVDAGVAEPPQKLHILHLQNLQWLDDLLALQKAPHASYGRSPLRLVGPHFWRPAALPPTVEAGIFAALVFFAGVAFFAGLAAFRLLNVSLATVANRVATMG